MAGGIRTSHSRRLKDSVRHIKSDKDYRIRVKKDGGYIDQKLVRIASKMRTAVRIIQMIQIIDAYLKNFEKKY